jgi:hypothetical protein
MAEKNDWIEEVKRWVASGGRPQGPELDAALDVEALGYEAAQPTLLGQGWQGRAEVRPRG